MLLIQHKQNSWIQTKQTEGQPCSDTSPYEVSSYSVQQTTNLNFTFEIIFPWFANDLEFGSTT